MKKRTWLKTSVSIFMALLMLCSLPLQSFAANFNPTWRTLRNAKNWWTPDIGTYYVAGTTNSSVAYYHYYLDKHGEYEFMTVPGYYNTPMEGAVYKSSGRFGTSQLGYAYSSYSLKIPVSHYSSDNDFYFALGGQPGKSGSYVFTVRPYQDWNTDWPDSHYVWHGRIWTRTSGGFYDLSAGTPYSGQEYCINQIIYLTPADINNIYLPLLEGLSDEVNRLYCNGYELARAVLDAAGLLDVGGTTASILYSLALTAIGEAIWGECENRVKNLAKLTKALKDQCSDPSVSSSTRTFTKYAKIVCYTSYTYMACTFEETFDVFAQDDYNFYGAERMRGKWTYVKASLTAKDLENVYS